MFGSKEDLLTSLREKHGHDFVSMSDLEKPTAEFMMRYFTTVLSQLGIDTQEIWQPKEQHPSQKAEIFPYVKLYRMVREVHPISKYLKNFSLTSVIDPKPDDILYVAVMDNFFDYFYQRTNDFLEPRLQEVMALREKVKQMQERKAALQQHLSDTEAARSRRAIAQAKAEEQLVELSAVEVQLTLQQKQVKTENEELEKEVQELRREVQELCEKQEEVEAQQEAQSQFGSLTKELEDLQFRKDEQEQVLAGKTTMRQEKASRRRFLENCIALEEKAMQEVGELLEFASEVEKQEAATQQSELKMESARSESQKWQSKLKELEEHLADVKKDNADIERENSALREKLEVAAKQIEERKLLIRKYNEETASVRESERVVEHAIAKIKESKKIMDQNFMKTYEELVENLQNFHQTTMEKLKQTKDN